MRGVVAVLVAVIGALVGGFVLWPSGPKCDAPAVLSTVADLARDRITFKNADFMLRRGGDGPDLLAIKRQISTYSKPLQFEFDSFRARSGRCAAIAYVMRDGRRTFELQADYAVERTTDGKTVVSARFSPN